MYDKDTSMHLILFIPTFTLGLTKTFFVFVFFFVEFFVDRKEHLTLQEV